MIGLYPYRFLGARSNKSFSIASIGTKSSYSNILAKSNKRRAISLITKSRRVDDFRERQELNILLRNSFNKSIFAFGGDTPVFARNDDPNVDVYPSNWINFCYPNDDWCGRDCGCSFGKITGDRTSTEIVGEYGGDGFSE